MKTILESYSIKELRVFINEHNKKARKETTEKLKQIRKNINKKAVIDIKGLTKKTDKDEIISRMLKQKQHFKDIKMRKQISQEEKEKYMDNVLNPMLKKAYLVYARTGDEDDVEVEVEEIFKKAKEMDIPSNYGITKKKMIKVIVDEGKKDKKIRDEIIKKRKTNKDIAPPKPPMPIGMFYSTQAKKFIINKPTRPAPKLPPKPTKKAPTPPKAKGKEKVSNEEPKPSTLQESVGDRPKTKPKKKVKLVIKPKKKEEPKKKKETETKRIIREGREKVLKDKGKIIPQAKQISKTWTAFMNDEYGEDYTLEQQKNEYDDMVKIDSKLPNSIPTRIKLNEFDKPKQEVFIKLFRTNYLNYIDLENDKTGQKKEFVKEREKEKKEKDDKSKKIQKEEIKKEKELIKKNKKQVKEKPKEDIPPKFTEEDRKLSDKLEDNYNEDTSKFDETKDERTERIRLRKKKKAYEEYLKKTNLLKNPKTKAEESKSHIFRPKGNKNDNNILSLEEWIKNKDKLFILYDNKLSDYRLELTKDQKDKFKIDVDNLITKSIKYDGTKTEFQNKIKIIKEDTKGLKNILKKTELKYKKQQSGENTRYKLPFVKTYDNYYKFQKNKKKK